jgi:hypothetical protein
MAVTSGSGPNTPESLHMGLRSDSGVGGRIGDFIQKVWSVLGKGASYVGLAYFQTWLGYKLSLQGGEAVTVFATVLIPINTAVFGGGAYKAWQKYRNGSSGSARQSSPSS